MNPQEIEEISTKAQIASEFRLLGFSEYAIKNFLQLRTEDIEQIIKKYKDAVDLMGDEIE